jgi:dinuclear metal center YbgI/SA1388 family protein
MKKTELFAILDGRFPPALQEKYDNAGVQVHRGDGECTGILIALDCDRTVIEEARAEGCNLILSHHPLLFRPLSRLAEGDPRSDTAFALIEAGISLYAAHTNLDKVYFDRLGMILGLRNTALLLPDGGGDGKTNGFGVIGEFDPPMDLEAVLALVKERLGLRYVLYSGERERPVRRLAAVNGAGGGSLEKIAALQGPDCVVTGDVGYHHVRAAGERGVAVIDAGHFGTERALLVFLRDEMQDCLTKHGAGQPMKVLVSQAEKDPFNVY